MDSLGVDSVFTNIPFKETTEVCTNELFKISEFVKVLNRFEINELLSLATKGSHFIFGGIPYKQVYKIAFQKNVHLVSLKNFIVNSAMNPIMVNM